MKRLLISLSFGILFPSIYLGFVFALILFEGYFILAFTEDYYEMVLGFLSLPVTWSVYLYEVVFRSNAYLMKDFEFSIAWAIWVITTNVVLYTILFYLILSLSPRFKKQNTEQAPPPPPQF